MKEFQETLYDAISQNFRIDKLYFESKTEHQHLMIFHNARLGRVMTLDGVVQTTEADEFVYHEMMAHVPLFAHGAAKRVLIIGGGDGGLLREVLKHPEIERVDVIEIDGYVTEAAVEKTKVVLDNHKFRQQMVDHNYELGVEHFSYSVLHRGLRAMLVQKGWIKSNYV